MRSCGSARRARQPRRTSRRFTGRALGRPRHRRRRSRCRAFRRPAPPEFRDGRSRTRGSSRRIVPVRRRPPVPDDACRSASMLRPRRRAVRLRDEAASAPARARARAGHRDAQRRRRPPGGSRRIGRTATIRAVMPAPGRRGARSSPIAAVLSKRVGDDAVRAEPAADPVAFAVTGEQPVVAERQHGRPPASIRSTSSPVSSSAPGPPSIVSAPPAPRRSSRPGPPLSVSADRDPSAWSSPAPRSAVSGGVAISGVVVSVLSSAVMPVVAAAERERDPLDGRVRVAARDLAVRDERCSPGPRRSRRRRRRSSRRCGTAARR